MDWTELTLTEKEAKKCGMSPHAGPYNYNMLDDLLMLARCIEDFKLRPERKFCLVKNYYERGDISRRWVDVWADGYTLMSDIEWCEKSDRESALIELRRVM